MLEQQVNVAPLSNLPFIRNQLHLLARTATLRSANNDDDIGRHCCGAQTKSCVRLNLVEIESNKQREEKKSREGNDIDDDIEAEGPTPEQRSTKATTATPNYNQQINHEKSRRRC